MPSNRCAWTAAVQDGMTELVCLLELPSGSSIGKGNTLRWWLLSWVGGRETCWDGAEGAVCAHACVRHLHPLSSGTRGVPGLCRKHLPWHFFIDLPSLSCSFSMHGGGFHLSSVTVLCNAPFFVAADRGDGVGSVTLFSCICRSAEGSRPVPSCSS